MSKIDDEALDWVVRQSGDTLTDADRIAFETWYDAHPRHQGAYLRAQAIWASLDKATVQSNLRPDVQTPKATRPIVSRRAMMGGIAVAAASVAGLGVLTLTNHSKTEIQTALGEMRKVPLSDRSVASLNSDSRVLVEMTPNLRRIVLVQGEALFEVAKDPKKPFVVEAGNVRVRAVGTAFSVRRKASGAEVLVTEGVVEVWNQGAAPRRLSAGHGAFVPDAKQEITVSAQPEEITRKLAWREGKIILQNQTLEAAVEEFNRYNRIKIFIEDPAIRDERLVGQYRLDQPEDFADTVRELMDVPVKVEPERIRLGDRKSSDKQQP